ncbi:MAG: A/G-specific adenine glycosylase [Myxococcota bacterium]
MTNQEGQAASFDGRIDAFRDDLLTWYDRDKRELPWRGIDDPYKTWVSEIMLQQTQVATVIDYYHRWLERFPTVEALAGADREQVMELWAGLGYYRRARFLHESATMVVDEFDGELPTTFDELQKLKGVGPYTAGAIASIAFGQSVPVVDGNVERVISRLQEIGGDPKSTANQKVYWALAEELVDPERPGDFNQAMMELGATICTPSSPSCMLCPVREHCHGFRAGHPEDFPGVASRARQKPVDVATCVLWRSASGGREYLTLQRPADGLLGGLWEFPTVETDGAAANADPMTDYLSGLDLDEVPDSRELGQLVHHFSHIRMTITAESREVHADAAIQSGDRAHRWVDEVALEDLPMSAAMRKVHVLFEQD